MEKETKQMFELLLNEIKGLRNEFTKEINDIKLDVKSNNLEMKNLRLQMESNHYETKAELFRIHQKLDTIVNQVAKSAEDITALRLDKDKELTNN